MDENTCIKFPSIEQFRNVKRNVEWKTQYQGQDESGEPIMNRLAKLPTLIFRGTEKLHGSNCSAVFRGGRLAYCQSRERVITPEDDNYGFARFMHSLPQEAIDELLNGYSDLVIYGEWAGKGIQNRVAICEMPKFWAIFAARNLEEEEGWFDISEWYTPQEIHRIYNLYWFRTWLVSIDFENPAENINQLNAFTLEVEKESPFAKSFGVSGIGEGIVWRCTNAGYSGSKFAFKTKGSEHSASKVTKLANVDVEKMKSISAFVDKHVNAERLQQGMNYLQENKLFAFEKSMGEFLRWVFKDIMKEEGDELKASGLSEKDLGSAVSRKAKIWYFEKIQNVEQKVEQKAA